MRFDFGILKDKELVGVIEYQGLQHFKPMDFSGKRKKEDVLKEFELIKLRDSIKKKWVIENNIPFLELRYDEDNTLQENVINFLVKIGVHK